MSSCCYNYYHLFGQTFQVYKASLLETEAPALQPSLARSIRDRLWMDVKAFSFT